MGMGALQDVFDSKYFVLNFWVKYSVSYLDEFYLKLKH